MPRETWAQDAAQDDAGAHRLSRSQTQRKRRRGRRGRGLFRGHGGHGLGRGLLGGGLLSGLFGLLSGLLGLRKKKSAQRGAHMRPGPSTGSGAKIMRASAPNGIKRPVATRGPVTRTSAVASIRAAGATTPGGRTEINFYRNGRLRTITGAFRMRLP